MSEIQTRAAAAVAELIEIAKLKSPERIKAIAQDQLGMSIPKHTYFSTDK